MKSQRECRYLGQITKPWRCRKCKTWYLIAVTKKGVDRCKVCTKRMLDAIGKIGEPPETGEMKFGTGASQKLGFFGP